jgi:REP element-mobilizing transposase RayT
MSYENAEGFKIRNQAATHFLTFTIVGWIDIFTRQHYRDIIIDSFKYCQQNKGLQIGGYVIMSNHVHTIFTATQNNLSDIVRDFKTYTSKAITKAILTEQESRRAWLTYMFEFYAKRTNANQIFKVWTSNNHPEEIYSREFLLSKLNYIHLNPVRAGLVAEPEHYLYSSASNYLHNKGLIEIDFLL